MANIHMGRQQEQQIIESFLPSDIPYGKTYAEWTVKWWEWALSAPIKSNPIDDDSGQHASMNQTGPVWFLAGTIGDDNKVAHRSCSVPGFKAILIPVINYIYTYESKFRNYSELTSHVTKDMDDIVTKRVVVDGNSIPIHRIKSFPKVFTLRVKEQNRLHIPTGYNKAAADGYWVFLKPLPEGQHYISFHGACSSGLRNAAADYLLRVTNEFPSEKSRFQ